MNRLGIMVDVSHVSDDAFYQVIELTEAPVIASHPSARHFTPGWERNMSDEMIEALAKKERLIMINFGSSFIRDETRKGLDEVRKKIMAWAEETGKKLWSEEGRAREDRRGRGRPHGHRRRSCGPHRSRRQAGGRRPRRLGFRLRRRRADPPHRTRGRRDLPQPHPGAPRRGYSEPNIAKICGENLLRVWRAVEKHAAST